MMAAPPQLLLRKPNGTAAGQTTNDAQNAPKTKPQPEGEKVVVRRLPPLLTEEEFFTILGDEWKMGHGKVDWFSYWPGKSSHHPSRPSRPSRAYFHVIKKDDLLVLSQAVQNGVWEDAKESYNDPVLILPPTVELSIHKKIPSDKKRLDNRQGTIDQEPEFMAFLESLANPDAHKNTDSSGEPNAEETSAKPEKITTTPLVEYLKEKKAQRAKEAALARSAKQHARQESQGGKTKTATATITLEELKKRAREAKGEKTDKVSQKLRDNVKILTKRGASSAAADAAKAANTIASQIQENARSSSKADTQTKAAQSSSQSTTQSTPSGDATPEIPKSRRAGIAAAARILQRDLGLSPGNAHRKARQEAAKAEADAKASAAASASANAAAAQEIASREKKERETAPAPSSAERSSTPANAADSSVAASPSTSARERESASGRTRGRRGRGGTTEEGAKSKGADGGRETKLAEVAAPQPPVKPTMILKKRDSTQAAPPSAPSAPSTPVVAQSPASQKPTTPKPSTEGKQRGGRGRGGEAKDNAQASSNVVNTPSTPAPTGPTQAFIKHAHQTQGVTESALRDAMQAFGPINSIDIRKKGLAYVDFADPEALKKAIAASPVTIARASITILERKSETDKKEGGGRDKEKETADPESATAAASAPMEKEKPVPEKENVKEKEKEKAPEKDAAREKRDDERRRGRGRGRGRDGGGGDKEKGEKGEKSDNARGAAKGDVAKETVPQGGSGSDRPVSAPKAERGNAGSAAATRPTSAQDKGEKDNKENEKGEKGDGDKNRRGRRRGGRGRGGGGDKDKERDKDGGGGGRGEKKTEGGGGSAQAASAS
ncbi:Smg-4/UPF3 family-domain-containing protein [Copromyces sp. CBS 386.78]|nr:Smg-4/UPF3 family-domain-containing protein [Copromyces sp. CBS 386.78]